MEIRRTANAGVLLKLDGVSILLDGVSQKVGPYLATPPDIKKWILSETPDALVFTHAHYDHYDPDFAAEYKACKNGVIIGPVDLSDDKSVLNSAKLGCVTILPVRSRHIGKMAEIEHFSYIIEGTQCVWFLGDASPLQWRQPGIYPKPDVLIVPFAYASTAAAWGRTKQLDAVKVVLVHLPSLDDDPDQLWDMVQTVTHHECSDYLLIPGIGESIFI